MSPLSLSLAGLRSSLFRVNQSAYSVHIHSDIPLCFLANLIQDNWGHMKPYENLMTKEILPLILCVITEPHLNTAEHHSIVPPSCLPF